MRRYSSLNLSNRFSHSPHNIASDIVLTVCARVYWNIDTMFPHLLISIIYDFLTSDNLFSISRDSWSYFAVWSLSYPIRISGVSSLLSIGFFVASFNAADTIENSSIVTININSSQAMTNFPSDNWKITLRGMYLLEWRKDIGMSYIKLVGWRFHFLQIHIYWSMSCVRELI